MTDIVIRGKTVEKLILPAGTTVSGGVATLLTPLPVDASATAAVPAGGLTFPTVDPAIAGAWWDNAGTLTKSAG